MFPRFSYTRLSGRRIFFRYLYRLIAAIFLIPFSILVSILKITATIYRFIAMPVAILVSAIAMFFCVKNGFKFEFINPIIGSIIGVGIYFVLPAVVRFLEDFRYDLKDFVVTPTIVRPRVKFVL